MVDNVPVARYGSYRDLDNQDSARNYTYDSIGNITRDLSESITSIKWSVYGKILEINRTSTANNNVTKIVYAYDAQGNRIGSTTTRSGTTNRDYVWYVRDAQGNAIAVYKATGSTNMGSLYPVLAERYIYGSSRLGSYNLETSVRDGSENMRYVYSYNFNRGQHNYELSNHLGNVLTTISDKKFGVPSAGNSSLIDYYTADVTNATSYYPFGSIMPARTWSNGGKYRFGFNGKENDNNVNGADGTQQDYGMRIYDPRVAKFLSVDPITKKYPELTPCQFASNRPIDGIDQDGLEFNQYRVYKFWKDFGKTILNSAVDLVGYVGSNPNHAGYDIKPKKINLEHAKKYEIDYKTLLDPTKQTEAFSHDLVFGTGNFVGGIIEGDGERTAKAIPDILNTWGALYSIRGMARTTGQLNTAAGNLKVVSSEVDAATNAINSKYIGGAKSDLYSKKNI